MGCPVDMAGAGEGSLYPSLWCREGLCLREAGTPNPSQSWSEDKSLLMDRRYSLYLIILYIPNIVDVLVVAGFLRGRTLVSAFMLSYYDDYRQKYVVWTYRFLQCLVDIWSRCIDQQKSDVMAEHASFVMISAVSGSMELRLPVPSFQVRF